MNKFNEHKIPVLSFYSGGGFMDMGFEKAGFEIVWTNEFDKVFAKLHAAGITSWRKSRGNGIKAEIFNTKSITDVKSNEIIEEAFPNGKPEHFGIIGGPPCQDFSMNGSRKGFKGERGKLTIVFFDKILELKPTFFVMENVTGLTKRKETKEFLQTLLKRIEKEYYVDHEKLNSLDFGVPQHRERIFFVGIRRKILDKKIVEPSSFGKWFPFPINEKYENALTKYNWGKQVEFGAPVIKSKDVPIELCVEKCLVPQNQINLTPNANEFFNLHVSEEKLRAINEGETNRPSFKRLHRFKYSPTTCYGNNEVHLHPYEHRRLSVREALRIQGVPDEYVLPEELPLTKKFKMIGNGVPVPLAEAVAEVVLEFINKNILEMKAIDSSCSNI
ncbi:DNA (cytosine-5-)-methyltransferase [Sphingobacterium spiritivorum ATCC 33300]|uniref:DNA (cytosine-5-)-methyltransferase n=1 Tax=Sphingobacterium spiritivorum ATCC 33300 TaxID=525372 RepID=C2G1Z3_SPHSI|nr:DNA cytosine methyltransferase [Sphingobacterium spiritivorum]EEI90683.1 DNA (cytosine-5-)-methyltransferase [Sphingobacterium spiritivorum ATCC 33300]QQS95638.1 DNA cytosine methyltransferase [Sphingobacterium spiritivorum]